MKRVFDLTSVALTAIVWLPVTIGLALLVLGTMGRPVFFIQTRPGRHGRPFRLVKFRTMREAADAEGRVLPDRERLIRFGGFLRSTSLDELPELWNLIKGDMSLVGPRPLLTEYLPLYTPEQARRHEVRPGITGWAQVNGRNSLSWEEKFALDLWYVDNHSLKLDLAILLLTVRKVLMREGINAEGEATMKPFAGTRMQ